LDAGQASSAALSSAKDAPPSLETTVKVAASLAVACYVGGLVTVSSYLYREGVSLVDPSALRARFAYTGAGVLLLLSTTVALGLLGLGIARGHNWRPTRGRDAPPRPSVAGRVAGCALVLLPFVGLICLLHWGGDVPFADGSLYPQAFSLWTVATVGGGAALASAVALFRRSPDAGDKGIPRWVAVAGLSIYALLFLVFYATLVSDYLYPRIPEQFGGGRPEPTRLLLSPEGVERAGDLGITACGGSSLSCRVFLIWRGDDFVAVRTRDGTTVELEKSLILGARRD
jgi:hypothetical protein